MRALPPVGVQSRALQLRISRGDKNLLLADNSGLGMAENGRATRIRASRSKFYMVRHPGHFTSMK